jgi:hypothetical protein
MVMVVVGGAWEQPAPNKALRTLLSLNPAVNTSRSPSPSTSSRQQDTHTHRAPVSRTGGVVMQWLDPQRQGQGWGVRPAYCPVTPRGSQGGGATAVANPGPMPPPPTHTASHAAGTAMGEGQGMVNGWVGRGGCGDKGSPCLCSPSSTNTPQGVFLFFFFCSLKIPSAPTHQTACKEAPPRAQVLMWTQKRGDGKGVAGERALEGVAGSWGGQPPTSAQRIYPRLAPPRTLATQRNSVGWGAQGDDDNSPPLQSPTCRKDGLHTRGSALY